MALVPRNTPYSLILSFFCCPSRRISMLCVLDPVKYWSAAPNDSCGTTRRSTCKPHRGARLAVSHDLAHLVIAHEALHDIGLARDGGEDVEIAHGFPEAAVTPGDHHLLHVARLLEPGHERLGVLRCDGELETRRFFRVLCQRLEDCGLGFLAEAGQLTNQARARGLPECRDRFNLEFVVKHLDPLRSQPREPEPRR